MKDQCQLPKVQRTIRPTFKSPKIIAKLDVFNLQKHVSPSPIRYANLHIKRDWPLSHNISMNSSKQKGEINSKSSVSPESKRNHKKNIKLNVICGLQKKCHECGLDSAISF
jgi:hypothetical protein